MIDTIIYIRTSTEEQNPLNQIKDCEKLLKREYELLQDKQSAYTDNKERKDFERAKKLIQSGKIKHFVVWDLDRIYRNRIKLKQFFEFCKLYKCEIHAINQQWLEKLSKIPEPFNEIVYNLMLDLMGWLAEDESKRKSDRVKLAVRKKNGITKSYKGNKWGRKRLSKQMRTKINEYAKENPKESLRMIANNLGISKSVVHKYIQDINKEKSNKNGHP